MYGIYTRERPAKSWVLADSAREQDEAIARAGTVKYGPTAPGAVGVWEFSGSNPPEHFFATPPGGRAVELPRG